MWACFAWWFHIRDFENEQIIPAWRMTFAGSGSASARQGSVFVFSEPSSCRDLCVDKIQNRQTVLLECAPLSQRSAGHQQQKDVQKNLKNLSFFCYARRLFSSVYQESRNWHWLASPIQGIFLPLQTKWQITEQISSMFCFSTSIRKTRMKSPIPVISIAPGDNRGCGWHRWTISERTGSACHSPS